MVHERPWTNDRYNKLCGSMRSLVHRLSLLPAEDPFRAQKEAEMLNKLWDMGVLGELLSLTCTGGDEAN